MDGNVKGFETREYLKLCQKQWRWILDNYDHLLDKGYTEVWMLKDAYFEKYGLAYAKSGCYLCELVDHYCLECPLSGIAWRKDYNYPCVNSEASVYWRITSLMSGGRYEEAKDAIKEFLSIIDNECRRW